MAGPIMDRGLNLSEPEVMTDSEWQEFRDFYIRTKGHNGALPAFGFWAENGPAELKRYRLQTRMTPTEAGLQVPLLNQLSFLHYYTIVGYEDGILYEVINVREFGATKAMVLETLAIAFLRAAPRGMRYVATGSQDYIRTYEDPKEVSPAWPEGWGVDPEAFKSGMDFKSPELQAGELKLLEDWYERVCGEVPASIHFLGRHRPNVLKAHRHRFEYAIKGALPTQMVPYMLLHLNVMRGCAPGIREFALMGRGLGMTDDQLIAAVAWGMIYGGPEAISTAAAALEGVL